ncbi:MAG: hypothetical protein BMS9Abin11_0140 [Gammaproteobacteria bacterium]|nr:MAG: hypothetical protein BMS9Abin11_0140 [Gammaproteobacteria bacterium]
MKILYSIVLSPFHPDFSALYSDLGCKPHTFSSERKAIQGLKSHVPDIVVADFIYGYSNNYAGVNVSNLDVFFHSLQKYKNDSKKIILVEKSEHKYVEKLHNIIPVDHVLVYPVTTKDITQAIEN